MPPRNNCRLALTPGEPAGIGIDISINVSFLENNADLLFITDPDVLNQRANSLHKDIQIVEHQSVPSEFPEHQPGLMNVYPVKVKNPVQQGRIDHKNSKFVLDCLAVASKFCLSTSLDGLVTGPVNKGAINDAGFDFTGHTEYLASLSHSNAVMMLATDNLRVALATTHIPLCDVSKAITQDKLEYVIRTIHTFLIEKYNINNPEISVCGLNPHAGENGHLGTEEINIIIPAINAWKKNNINIKGPLPADTVFTPENISSSDIILAMYHDQGLPVLKHSGFGKAVNITMGLPYIRTSVDHGTALDLAGSGKVNNNSMIAAINSAKQLSSHN